MLPSRATCPRPAPLLAAIRRSALLGFLFSAFLTPSPGQASGVGPPGGDPPVITYRQEGARTDESGPSLKLWDDGRVEVLLPSYHVRAGRYAGQLGSHELHDLLRDLRALDLETFDPASTRTRSLELAAERGELFHATGAGWSVFELRLGPEPVSLAWKGLRFEARAYPENQALARLAEAERRLIAVLRDSRWQRSEEPAVGTDRPATAGLGDPR